MSSSTQQLVSALIISWIDYCNLVLYGLLAITLAPLRRVLHAAVCVLADHVRPSMIELLWLSIAYCIKYKLCLMIHSAVNNRSPAYITEYIHYNIFITSLSAASFVWVQRFDVPRLLTEFGRWAFSIASLQCGMSFKTMYEVLRMSQRLNE